MLSSAMNTSMAECLDDHPADPVRQGAVVKIPYEQQQNYIAMKD